MGMEIDGVRAAFALADACGATVDHLRSEGLMRFILPLIERGAVQTSLSEIRNRADFVLVLGPDPRCLAPRLFERVIPPSGLFLASGGRRLTFLGGAPEAELPAHLTCDTIPAPGERLAEVAGALARLCSGKPLPKPEIAEVAVARLEELARQMRQARYGVALFAPGLMKGPQAELAIAALLHLVQELNSATRWAALPIAGGDGLVGAAQAMLWQSGLPLRSRFDALGPRFDPHRFSTQRLLAEGEADLLLWISAFRPTPPPDSPAPLIALAHPQTRFARPPSVFFPVGVPGVDHGGAMFRTDGLVALPLSPTRSTSRRNAAELLSAILRTLPRGAA
jgi:formylmethanofuran dehydrogenase subunit B